MSVGVSLQLQANATASRSTTSPATTSTPRRRSPARPSCSGRRAENWEARVIFSGERARDGDYALNDLGGAAREPVSRLARLRGLHQPRHPRHDHSGPPRTGGAGAFVEHDRLRQVEDRGRRPTSTTRRFRSSRATTPKRTSSSRRRSASRRRTPPSSLSDTAALEMAERASSSSRRTTIRTPSTCSRRSCSRRSSRCRSAYSPLSDLDDFGLGVFGQGTVTFNERLDVDRRARGSTTRTRARTSKTLLRSGDRAADVGRRRRQLLERLAAVRGRLSRAARRQMVYGSVGERLQGRRVQPGVAAGSEAYGEEHDLELRRRREDAVRERTRRGQRRRLLHRLGRPAAQRAEPVRARAVLHRQRRRRDEQGRGVRAHGQRPQPASTCSACSATRSATLQRRQHLGRPRRVGQRHPEHAGLHGQLRRASTGRIARIRRRARTAAPTSCYGAFKYDDANTSGQDAYSLVNFRGGVRGKLLLRRSVDAGTRSTRTTFRSRSRTARSRRRGSSARTARRARSG